MSISDRLDEIEDDIHAAFRLPKDAPVAVVAEEWAPDMLAALRAVLDRHPKGTARAVGGTGGRDVEHCLGCLGARGIAHDDHGLVPWPCPTVRAMTAALGEES